MELELVSLFTQSIHQHIVFGPKLTFTVLETEVNLLKRNPLVNSSIPSLFINMYLALIYFIDFISKENYANKLGVHSAHYTYL